MQKAVVVLDTDKGDYQDLCALIEKSDCRAYVEHSLPAMEALLLKSECSVVLMDIDSVPMDNRTIREMTIKYPGVYFLCLSSERFHPELKEALCYHIYACINKPVDPDEIHFWLRTIFENHYS